MGHEKSPGLRVTISLYFFPRPPFSGRGFLHDIAIATNFCDDIGFILAKYTMIIQNATWNDRLAIVANRLKTNLTWRYENG